VALTVDRSQVLKARGIRLRCYQPCEHRAPCPERDRGSRDDAVASRIDLDGSATWLRHSSQSSGSIEQILSRFSIDQRSEHPRP
jgi:hypothetical protein